MKKLLLFLVVVLIVVAGVWYFKQDNGQPQDETNNTTGQNSGSNSSSNSSNSSSSSSSDEEDTTVMEIGNTLSGELKASNDTKRGNLMLMLTDSDRVIYLHTSRDYTALIDKEVVVTIDGSLDDFRLVDITER